MPRGAERRSRGRRSLSRTRATGDAGTELVAVALRVEVMRRIGTPDAVVVGEPSSLSDGVGDASTVGGGGDLDLAAKLVVIVVVASFGCVALLSGPRPLRGGTAGGGADVVTARSDALALPLLLLLSGGAPVDGPETTRSAVGPTVRALIVGVAAGVVVVERGGTPTTLRCAVGAPPIDCRCGRCGSRLCSCASSSANIDGDSERRAERGRSLLVVAAAAAAAVAVSSSPTTTAPSAERTRTRQDNALV